MYLTPLGREKLAQVKNVFVQLEHELLHNLPAGSRRRCAPACSLCAEKWWIGGITVKRTELVRRYLFLLVGLFINSFGVAFITKAIWAPRPSPASPTP